MKHSPPESPQEGMINNKHGQKKSSCWTQTYHVFTNIVDPDKLASEEAKWSGSALFAINFVNLYQ